MIKKWKKTNNKGMSFIVVIIIMAVVTFVVGAGIAIVNANHNLKNTKLQSNKNYYNAEAGLNEIRGCIQEKCTDAFESAYNIVTNSITKIPQSELDSEFAKMYLDELENMFLNVSTDYTLLTSYARNGGTPIVYLDLDGKYTISADGCVKTSDAFTIKKVKVTYNDGNFVDTIVTDIVCKAPSPFGKSGRQTNLIDVYSQYALIADGNVNIANTGEIVRGSVYAGENINIGYNKACNTRFYSNNIVTRGDIVVYPQSKLQIESYKNNSYSNLYINNLVTAKERFGGSPMVFSNRSYNALNIKGNLYLYGDTLLNAKYGDFTLNGGYYGYSSKKENNNSSALSINSSFIDLDFTNAQTLWIAGNNYIDLPSILEETNANDVLTGESLTGKFTQTLYLVPSVCIYNEDENGNRTYLPNPIDKVAYPNYKVDLSMNKKANGIDLTKFTNGSFVDGKFQGGFKEVNVQFYVGSKLINRTYLYLDIKDDATASKYLLEYSILNSALLNNRAKSFRIGNISIAENCLVKTNGNVLTFDGENVTIQNVGVGILDSFTGYQENFIFNKYNNLIHTLTETSSDDNESLFEYMINVDKIKSSEHSFAVSDAYFIAPKVVQYNNATESYGDVEEIRDDSGKQYFFLVADGDVTIKKDFYGIVIATGNINIVSNQVKIHGTLIAGKDINFGIPYCNIDNQGANISALTFLLSQYEYHNLFRDYFNSIESDEEGLGRKENVDIASTITYKNWVHK